MTDRKNDVTARAVVRIAVWLAAAIGIPSLLIVLILVEHAASGRVSPPFERSDISRQSAAGRRPVSVSGPVPPDGARIESYSRSEPLEPLYGFETYDRENWLAQPRMGLVTVLTERAELRRDFPLVPVGKSLAYEQSLGYDSDVVPALDENVRARLADLDHAYEKYNTSEETTRRRVLEDLHDATRDEFIRGNGFGYIRTPIIAGRKVVALPDPGVITPVPVTTSPNQSTDSSAAAGGYAMPAKRSLVGLHDKSRNDFLHPDRFGYIRNRDEIAGFVSHRLSRMPGGVVASKHDVWLLDHRHVDPMQRDEWIDPNDEHSTQWMVKRLNLVSLLRFKKPMVYLTEHLPRLDLLQEVSIRELDDFERTGLKRLLRKQDLVTLVEPARIRVLGSLRAARICTDCHSVGHGELLGAFSYELVPALSDPVRTGRMLQAQGASPSGLN